MLALLDAGPMPHEPPAAIITLIDVIDLLVDLLIDPIILYVPHICYMYCAKQSQPSPRLTT